MQSDARDQRRGTIYAIAAWSMWGMFPLYFPLLEPAGAAEITAHRVVWSLVVVGGILAVTVGFGPFREMLRSRRRVGLLTIAAALIAVNWCLYVYAVNSEQVTEAALGYFINPLVSVFFGVVFFRERLRPAQIAALSLGAFAVLVLTIDYGRLPWIALTLAVSFGSYGLVKKLAGVGALDGLALETFILLAPALALLIGLQLDGSATFGHEGAGNTLLLLAAGPVTAAPLLFFAGAVNRVPLSLMGLLQYITPTLQFLIGVAVFGEHMPTGRWVGFGLVWIALTILSADALRAARRSRTDTAPEPAIA